jgi:DNA-binding XRE family transcriptional regulator
MIAIKLHASFAVHPGGWLRDEIFEPYGLGVTAAAEKLGVTRQPMSNILNGHAGPETRICFEKAFGLRADADAGRTRFKISRTGANWLEALGCRSLRWQEP